jgi:hypothetical protein
MQALVVAGLCAAETVLTEIRVRLHGSARAFRLLQAAARFFPVFGVSRSRARAVQKNKVVGAVCRQRPCQPRKLKSAHAFR